MLINDRIIMRSGLVVHGPTTRNELQTTYMQTGVRVRNLHSANDR